MTAATTPPPAPVSSGRFGWGILATGGIARLFTRDLLHHGHRVVAVGSRNVEKARAFTAEFGIARAHGSYEDLVTDPDVDIVYVATPHNFHVANTTAALEHGKHVLVEKPFTVTAAEARTVAELARTERLLVMEAMWTRFLPHMEFVRSTVAGGRIGTVRSLHADHTQRLSADPAHRLNDPNLAGGALLDLGAYPLSFAHDILGAPVGVTATGVVTHTGVDAAVATMLRHENGAISTSYSSMETRGPNVATILGTDGRIDIGPVWYAPAEVTVRDARGEIVDGFEHPVSGRGMQYQAAEVERLLTAGESASPLMTPEDSVAVMATLDAVRAAVGVRYPGECSTTPQGGTTTRT